MSKEFEDLIGKHLAGTLNGEEKRQLAVMLAVPENQFYLASKIDQEFPDQEVAGKGEAPDGKAIFELIQQRIRETELSKTVMENPAPVMDLPSYQKRRFRWMAVAASLLILVALGIQFLNRKQAGNEILVKNGNKPVDSVAYVLRHEVNNTGKDRNISLPDGSIVLLADNSEVSYREPFINSRDISLTGKAFFKVAKDKTKPFTVTSSAISITALGTEFLVTAYKSATQITVRLYEGKVVIKGVDKRTTKISKDVFLLPGQEFVYNHLTGGMVRNFKADENKTGSQNIRKQPATDHPYIEDKDGSWYMFNNQSLAEVLNQLTVLYNTDIQFNKNDLKNIYFTGRYNRSDSLIIILKQIAQVHKLKITRSDSAFILTR